MVSPWLRHLALESVMCWQILAVDPCGTRSMKVYDMEQGFGRLPPCRFMIVGRDTDRLDDAAVTRAAVEAVTREHLRQRGKALLLLCIGGAP